MKKKVQRRLFVLIFILGLVVGILVPIELIKSQFGKITGNSGERIYDISKKFIYVNRGRADLMVGSKKSEISAGNVESISPESTVKIERVGDSPAELIIFSTGSFDEKMIS